MKGNPPDLRHDRRYKLPGTFVVNAGGVGEIINLSYGGLCFGCVNDKRLPESLTVDIVNSRGAHIWDVPVETVWLVRGEGAQQYTIHRTIVGVRFKHCLSPEQKSALDCLIDSLPA